LSITVLGSANGAKSEMGGGNNIKEGKKQVHKKRDLKKKTVATKKRGAPEHRCQIPGGLGGDGEKPQVQIRIT